MSARSAGRDGGRRWGLVAISVAMTLLLAEGALRLLGLPRLVYSARRSLTELDPEVLYRELPSSSLNLNSLGFRDREFGPRDPRRKRVLVVGDSFVMGLNLRAEQTLPRRLQDRLGPGFEVLNFGIYGYGPDQEYLRLAKEGLPLSPSKVVLVLYPNNDFRDVAKNRLYDLDGAGRLRRTASNPVSEALARPRLEMLLRRASTGHFLPAAQEQELMTQLWGDIPDTDLMLHPESPASKHKVDLMRALLARFRDDLAARGVAFGVVVMPSVLIVQGDRQMKKYRLPGDREAVPERLALGLCQELRLEVFDLTPGFRAAQGGHLYAQRDFHLSRNGSQTAAKLLAPWVASL